jgi:hypothetical protein
VQADLGGLDRLVAKPERDYCAVDAGPGGFNRHAMSKDVRRCTVGTEAAARRLGNNLVETRRPDSFINA